MSVWPPDGGVKHACSVRHRMSFLNMRPRLRLLLLCGALVFVVGCGTDTPPRRPLDGAPGPTPTPAPAFLPAPENLVYEIRPALGRMGARITWSRVPTATEYVVSVASSLGDELPPTAVTPTTDYVIEDVPIGGRLFV